MGWLSAYINYLESANAKLFNNLKQVKKTVSFSLIKIRKRLRN